MPAPWTPTLVLAAALAFSQQGPPATYRTQTGLVLVPFHVGRDKYYVSDLQQSDIVLLEDGKPRAYTTFEGPETQKRTLELVLLFDTSHFAIQHAVFDLSSVYAFIPAWNDEMSRSVLEQGKASVQTSIYRFDGDQLLRLCRSTADPAELGGAFQHLLTPMPDSGSVQLTLPQHRNTAAPLTAWTFPAAIETLKDASAAAEHMTRSMVIFARGQAYAQPAANNVPDLAVALGIPIYPVILDLTIPRGLHTADARPVDPELGRQLTGQNLLRRLAELTGGSFFDVTSIDAARMRDILESVKNEALSQYVVGFVPPPSSQPRPHKLEVRLVSKSSGKMMGGTRSATY